MCSLNLSNKNLTTLEGIDFPSNLEILYCHNNQLTSLRGCPSGIRELYCHNNRLTSLEGCPDTLKELCCFNNQLTSLEGCPFNLTDLHCGSNQLTSLEGCPPNLKMLSCYNNQLTSLEDCPFNINVLYCSNNPLNHEYKNKSYNQVKNINKLKRFKRGINIINKIYLDSQVNKIIKVWDKYWYQPNFLGSSRHLNCVYEEYSKIIK